MRGNCGFTLMELMIVVAVASILAAISYPMYTDYLVRGTRSAAKVALTDAAARQEAYFNDRKTYSSTLAGLGLPADPYYVSKDGKQGTTSTADMVYSISLTTGTAGGIVTTYTLTATPVNGQTRDNPGSPPKKNTCGSFILDSTGNRTVSPTATLSATDCWAR